MTTVNKPTLPRLLVIFNPVAGRRRRQKVNRFIATCAAGGVKVELHQTIGPDDARSVAARASRQHYDAVVAAGGDGTVNETLNGLLETQDEAPLPLGVLPLGTANVLAHELALPRRPEEAARTVLSGALQHVAIGLANGRHFVLMAGVGFDAAVVAGVNSTLKRRIHQGAYVVSSLQMLRRFSFPHYRVTVGEETFIARSLIACKARHYGGPFVLAPKADLGTPSFQILLFERGGILNTCRYGIALLLGRLHKAKGVRLLEAAAARIEGPEGEAVQADGELVTELPLTLGISATGLNVLVPRS